jgi:hypothetical protein
MMPSRAIVLGVGAGTVTVVWHRFFHGAGMTSTEVIGFVTARAWPVFWFTKRGLFTPRRA